MHQHNPLKCMFHVNYTISQNACILMDLYRDWPPLYTSTHVCMSTTQSVTFWELPVFLSQSSIGGHQGSNACTVISLLLAKTHITNKSLLQLNNHQSLTPSWILAFISCIMGGKSDIWQFHTVTITSWHCQSHRQFELWRRVTCLFCQGA